MTMTKTQFDDLVDDMVHAAHEAYFRHRGGVLSDDNLTDMNDALRAYLEDIGIREDEDKEDHG